MKKINFVGKKRELIMGYIVPKKIFENQIGN